MNEDRTLQVLAIEYEALRAEILMCATTAINLFRLARGRRSHIGRSGRVGICEGMALAIRPTDFSRRLAARRTIAAQLLLLCSFGIRSGIGGTGAGWRQLPGVLAAGAFGGHLGGGCG